MNATITPVTSRQLFNTAFPPTRDPRSEEYQLGVLAYLSWRLGEQETIPQPYVAGTAQADAYIAGTREGNDIYRQYKANLPH